MNSPRTRRVIAICGPLAALAIAFGTSSVRDSIESTSVGIVLAVIVVLAALSSRVAGLLTAIVAALAFNFFHAEPVHSLRIDRTADVVIVALLAATGLVIGDLTAWLRRRDVIDARYEEAANAPKRVADLLAVWSHVGDLWPALTTMIMDQLSLADCTFDPSGRTDLSIISRTATTAGDSDDGFVLPGRGAAIRVASGDRTLGHLILKPRDGITSLWVERRVVVALADHLAIALTYTGHRTGRFSIPKTENTNG